MRRITGIFIGVIVAAALMLGLWISQQTAAAAAWETKVDPWVLETAQENNETEFLVYLYEQADLSAAAQMSSKTDKGAYVYAQLTAVAQRTQPAVLAQLDKLGVDYQPFWITNMIWVRGNAAVVEALARREDVAHLYANPTVPMPEITPDDNIALQDAIESIEWNITHVNADDVWTEGYTGQGVVVGGQDTGYYWSHSGLINQYRGWNGSSADHNYNWHDSIHSGGGSCGANSPFPCDDHGHGTHTMGTMVGNDLDPNNPGWPAGATNAVGMAPGATWIGCRNMNQGNGTPATYSECYQWFIAPTDLNNQNPNPAMAPDVINNSWGCPISEGCTDPNVLLTVVQNVRAAGIVTVHAAGNNGSGCSSVNEPATIYDESFSVGATNSSDVIASFSGRGPVTVDSSGRMKPDISAPGVNIRSTTRDGGYQGGWNGTSMAGPHVAGLVALILSANPSLAGDVDTIEQIITETAVPRTTTQGCGGDGSTDVPNNVYGWGRIDALAAVNMATFNTLTVQKTAAVDWITAGELLTYTIDVTYHNVSSPTNNVVLTDVIPVNTTFVTATMPYTLNGSVVEWQRSSLGANQTWQVQLVVRVAEAATGDITNADYQTYSDEVTAVSGDPVVTPIFIHTLALHKTAGTTLVSPGEWLTYTLVVTHQHDIAPTTNVVLTDTIPQNTTLITATEPFQQNGDVISWQTPTLAANGTWQVNMVVAVDPFATTDIVNEAYGVRSDDVDTVMGAPVTTTIQAEYGLTMTLTASGPAVPGTPLTYTFTVSNPHPVAPVHNLILTDTLPAQTTFITATMPFTIDGNVIMWTSSSLNAGEVWQVNLVVGVALTATGTIENAVYGVMSDEVTAVSGPPLIIPVAIYHIYLPFIKDVD